MNFDQLFQHATGHLPFPWQERLYQRFVRGDFPQACDIPTGLGKTAVIPLWLLALAAGAPVPRRLIYVVNRRTVVDQATETAKRLREAIGGPPLASTAEALTRMASFPARDVIAISTLRGELADNEEWKCDPARPAIIIGTIDMMGSKLLFSGYGDRRYGRAHHAGLVGQDTLIVHDEAHLTPAFGQLLRAVAAEQQKDQRKQGRPMHVLELSATGRQQEQKDQRKQGRPMHVLELSATGRQQDEGPITLLPEDEVGEREPAKILRQRLDAEKWLHLHLADAKRINEKLVELAEQHAEAKAKVLIYVTNVEDARTVADMLTKRFPGRAELLTGTLRGFERDELVKTPVFQALLGTGPTMPKTLFLISTSAGEVGVDLDADHMVCDLTTLDSMIQRLGRVNRRGGRSARVDVVVDERLRQRPEAGESEARKTVRKTLAFFCRWQNRSKLRELNLRPRILHAWTKVLSGERSRALFSPSAPAIPATDILFDAWSLTSIRGKLPGRPDVAAFLHGITKDPPETHVAWRHEGALLAEHGVKPGALGEWFRACPLKSRELLRDRTDRIVQHLGKIRDRAPGIRIILLGERGDAETLRLDQLPQNKDDAHSVLAFKTVLLPVEAGGLDDKGMLNGAHNHASDVAEKLGTTSQQQPERLRARLHVKVMEGEFTAHPLDPAGAVGTTDGLTGQCKSPRDAVAQLARSRRMRVSLLLPLVEPLDDGEGESSEYLALLTERAQIDPNDPENAPSDKPPTISAHTCKVVERVTQIANALALGDQLKQVLTLAAELHDSGKCREIWQRAIYNFPVTGEPLAKPKAEGLDWRRLAGFRHEFGSLLDAAQADDVQRLSEELRELVLHLISAHHGHGRPHFEPETFNFERHGPQENEAAARECIRRFARLQLKYGRWHLAWLESLLRCADAAASSEPPPTAIADAPR